MLFDLHIHTSISDGDLDPEAASLILRRHADYVTVTDHDNPTYHLMDDTGCSFTGEELTSNITIKGMGILTEVLFYGFSKSDVCLLNENDSLPFDMSLDSLAEYVQPIKDRTGAKLFLAHPGYCKRGGIEFIDILDLCGQYVDGFECLHESATEYEARFLLEYCRKNNKLASGGSDSHSDEPHKTPYLHLVDEYKELFQWIPEMAKKRKQS